MENNKINCEEFDDFSLLPDRPLQADEMENDKFGHLNIANSIFCLLDKAETPFTLGLFGKWGVGKTGIANLVKDIAEKSSYKTFFFDVWKYERDSLRRQFLIELDDDLKLGFKYKEDLNQSLSVNDPTVGEIKFDKRLLFNKLGIIFLIMMFLGFIFPFLKDLILKSMENYPKVCSLLDIFPDNFFDLSGTTFFTLGLAGYIVNVMINSISRVQQSVTKFRTDSAEGFEGRFKDILDHKKIKDKKLLIIIDNLDRIEDKKAVEVLSDIKTFLSKDNDKKNNVLFLVACDNLALRQQLFEIYGYNFDADEFLRKFFNLTFSIPKIIDIDLDDYVKNLLNEARIVEYRSKSLEDVIIYSFRSNPREIKQFINSLTSVVVMAKKQKIDVVLKNISFLAKLLIIRQKFPILFKVLEEKSLRETVTLDDNNLLVAYKEELNILKHEETRHEKWVDEKLNNFKKFNKLTKEINVPYVDVFLTLKQSEDEKIIPEWSSYVLAAEEGRLKDAAEIVDKLEEREIEKFDKLSFDRVRKLKNGKRVLSFVTSTLHIAAKRNISLKEFSRTSATHFPYGIDIASIAGLFSPNKILKYWLVNLSSEYQDKIKNGYVGALSKANDKNEPIAQKLFVFELLEIISDEPILFKDQENKIKGYISSHLYKFPYITKIKSEESIGVFVTKESIGKYIDSLDYEAIKEIDDFREAISYIQNFIFSDEDSIKNTIKKFREIGGRLIDVDLHEQRTVWSKHLNKFILGHFDIVQTIEDEAFISDINQLSVLAADYFTQALDFSIKKEFINLIDTLCCIAGSPVDNKLRTKIKEFIVGADDEDFLSLNDTVLDCWVKNYSDLFISRSISRPKILVDSQRYKNFSTDEQRGQLVITYLDNNKEVLEILRNSEYQFDNKTQVIDKIIEKLPNLDIKNIFSYIMAMKKLGIGNDALKIQTLVDRLQDVINSNPLDLNIVISAIRRQKGLFNSGQLAQLLGDGK